MLFYEVVVIRFGSEIERVSTRSQKEAVKIAQYMKRYYGVDYSVFIYEYDSAGACVDGSEF